MTDKMLINSPLHCVRETLYGFSQIYPHLGVDLEKNIVYSDSETKIPIISGGGSGHEPFPAGYVGKSMLSASVSGGIFTSPPPKHIFEAICLVAKSKRVLLLVPNYTGDVLNFGLAAEMAKGEGFEVKTVIIGEDISQKILGSSKAGKRGMCGLVLIFKIIGYFSCHNYGLTDLELFTLKLKDSMASMGLCTTPCCKPGVGPLFHLNPNEMELGVGVHGEAGIARVEMMTAEKAAYRLVHHLTESLQLKGQNEVVVMINNLGGLSCLEEWIFSGEVAKKLNRRQIKIARMYSGCFFTSLNMSGVQVCILSIQKLGFDVLSALDHDTKAPAWNRAVQNYSPISKSVKSYNLNTDIQSFNLSEEDANFLKECFIRIADNLKKEEKALNYLDGGCGDGDCGTSFSRIADEIKNHIDDLQFSRPAKLFFDLSLMMGDSIGGTTGALYALFFRGIYNKLKCLSRFESRATIRQCWREGVEFIKKYSSARLGDRTMLDSLETGCVKFESKLNEDIAEEFRAAVLAAGDGCRSTKSMKALAGRASYTHKSQLKDLDAGAYAVFIWLTAIEQVLNERQSTTKQ